MISTDLSIPPRPIQFCDEPWAVCAPPLSPSQFTEIRNRLVLDCCKWDPQVGDTGTLAPFAVVLTRRTWRQLAALAEQLTAEAMAAEKEVLDHPEWLGSLGLPRRVRRVLAATNQPLTLAAARVFRFDFHATSEGWRISEANADVPGGYCEASSFAAMMADRCPGTAIAGDPAARLAGDIARHLPAGGRVALLAATGYMEDQQVIAYLAGRLRQFGCQTYRAHPRQCRWLDGTARLQTDVYAGPLDAIIRFYQGEWLGAMPVKDWQCFFRGGRTPVCNPGSALVVESKRFPLLWDRLTAPLVTWRALLPETRDPRRAGWRRDPTWLLKTAFCNTGDTVTIRDLADARAWRRAAWEARWLPWNWAAQRRFEPLSLPTPLGPKYPCLGVYTVGGAAAGIYGRLASHPVVDYAAMDVAVLIDGRPAECAQGDEPRNTL